MANFEEVIIMIDALDEFAEVRKLVYAFDEFLSQKGNGTKTFIITTSRENVNIEKLIQRITTFRLSLADKIGQNITTYVSAQVEELIISRTLKLRDPDLAGEIVRSLVRQADGM